jgi:hypothetical protein
VARLAICFRVNHDGPRDGKQGAGKLSNGTHDEGPSHAVHEAGHIVCRCLGPAAEQDAACRDAQCGI